VAHLPGALPSGGVDTTSFFFKERTYDAHSVRLSWDSTRKAENFASQSVDSFSFLGWSKEAFRYFPESFRYLFSFHFFQKTQKIF